MRRAAILVTSLVTLASALAIAGCNLYFGDDDHHGKNHPQDGSADAGPGNGTPDGSCGGGPDHPDGGFVPDAGAWPDGGFWPDASPGW